MAAAHDGELIPNCGSRVLSRLQPRGVGDTISLLVTLTHPFHRLLVLVLAAWVSLCCCEKRMLADAIGGYAGAARSCCERDCCCDDDAAGDATGDATEGGGDREQDHGKQGCCADGCCAKAAPSSASFALDFDRIGCALPPSFGPGAPVLEAGRVLSHEDRAVGEPPPRLGLIISRRLRI